MNRTASRLRDSMSEHAQSMRDRALSEAKRRKEEYVGARVPRDLKQRVIKKADQLGIPVSLLIRNVLEDAFGKTAPESATTPVRQAQQNNKSSHSNILAWEKIILNKTVRCSQCRNGIEAGMNATLGIAETGGVNIILCGGCSEMD